MYDAQRGSLYRNLGNGHFKDVTHETGLDQAHGKCLGVLFADIDGDGWPDIYLCNDEMPGDLFLNRPAAVQEIGRSNRDKLKRFASYPNSKDREAEGHTDTANSRVFREEASLRGVALSEEGKPQGAMGVDMGDVDRNGNRSLVVAAFQFEGTSLYTDAGDGTYTNRSTAAGIERATRPYVGFGIKFADFDNDGWLDIAQANGHVYDNEENVDKMSHYRQPIQLFMNSPSQDQKLHQKQTKDLHTMFVECTKEAGPGFTTPCVGRALAIGDLDNDGRLDMVVTDLEGNARVLFNRIPATGNWLRIRLEGKGTKSQESKGQGKAFRSNRMGIGAHIKVIAGDLKWEAEATTCGSYLASSDVRVHIGLGAVTTVDRVEVTWPSGSTSVIKLPRIPGDLVIRE